MWWLLEKPVVLLRYLRELIFLALGGSLLSTTSLLGKENSLNVWKNSSLGNSDTRKQLVEFLIVSDSQLEMSWVDPLFLVVPCSVSSQLKDLSGQVLHDCGQVDWGASAYSLRIVSLAKQTVDTSNWKL